MRTGQANERKRRGATVVETAVVLSGLLLFFLAIFEYGRFIMVQQLVENAAREGARQAVGACLTNANSFNYQTTASIQNTVTAGLAGQAAPLSGTNILVYLADGNGNDIGAWTSASFGANIAVEIDTTYNTLFPGLRVPFFDQWITLIPGAIPLTTKAVMACEGN